jgi:hypothetical protein
MKGSTHSIYLVLGCAAALASASACSHSTPEPSVGTSPGRSTIQDQSPASTGGSNLAQPGFDAERETQGAAQPGAMQPGTMQPGTMPQGQPGATQPGGAPLPGAQGTGVGASPQTTPGSQPGGPGTTGRTIEPLASINEREACDLLVSEAVLHTEAIEGGVAIVAKPRRSSDVSTVRNRMQSIHRGIERGGPASAEVQCELFALGRNGVASLIETPDSIRLLVTTNEASRVPQLRRQANEFMRSKGTPAQRGGTPQRAKPRDGTPQHSDETPQPPTP